MARSKPCTASSPEPLTYDALIAQIARVAFADVRRLFNPDGTLKPLRELDDDTAAALSVEIEEGSAKRTAKLKIDRIAALALLGKYLIEGPLAGDGPGARPDGLTEAIARSRARALERQRQQARAAASGQDR